MMCRVMQSWRWQFYALVSVAAVVCYSQIGNARAEEGLPAAEGSPAARFKHGNWPFQPPARPDVPEVKDKTWGHNPIDAFILAKLEEKSLSPSPPAEKLALLRRATFDLTGLPPTTEEQHAFLNDNSPDAYLKVVDRLLASPRYGERAAQHWLDVVRYAETDGFKEDAHRPNAYRYRDYVIKSFNDDLPYDRFVQQQLAGDELEPANPDALIATGLNRLYPDEYNAANVKQRRQELLDEITDVTGLAFLGLTMGCAQCHDHKFDEILQTDYFRLQAFFTPMLPRDDVVVATHDERREFAAQQAVWDEATAVVRSEIDQLLADKRQKAMQDSLEKFEPDVQAMILKPDHQRSALERQWVAQAMKFINSKYRDLAKTLKGEEKEKYDALEKRLAEFDHLKPEPLPTAMGITDAAPLPPPTFRLATGNFRKPQEEVSPGFPAFLSTAEPEILPPADVPNATGRRSALARWLTGPDHPLTARIMMNRVWQQHFGVGIVGTANDFGAMGEEPSHPDLLDWLAAEFIESGWSLKKMHRLMVTSATYQQSAFVDPQSPAHERALQADPQNTLLWHYQRRRLDGESIRDAMLQVAGRLNLRMYGPSGRPELPASLHSSYAWKPDAQPENRNRRSIYILAKRNLRLPLLEVFDQPDMHNSCARRANTTTAPQALSLLNGEFVLDQARHLSENLLANHADNLDALVRDLYAIVYCRQPREDEVAAARQFVSRQAETIAEHRKSPKPDNKSGTFQTQLEPAQSAAVFDLCHAVLNSNEFLFVD
jgi:hypothetical protein